MNAAAALFTLELTFHGDLAFFLRRERGQQKIVRQLGEKTSVKDAIEACGVPHPEIDLILVDGSPVDFFFQLERDAAIEIYPATAPAEFFPRARLQRPDRGSFVADGHLGKLTRYLRLLGIDVDYAPRASDAELLARALGQERVLLTRDRALLMHAAVRDGYYPRSQQPDEQTREVIERFRLRGDLKPFTRCLHCNGFLDAAPKSEVIEQLEPLTKIYYESFRRCRECGWIYWRGSHFARLQNRIELLLA